MSFSESEPKFERMSVDELVKIRGSIKSQLSAYSKDSGVSFKDHCQQVLEKFLQQLKSQKDKFKQVFTTESGSIYFIVDTGQCLRFKKGTTLFNDPDKKYWEIGEVMQNILFLDESVRDDLLKTAKRDMKSPEGYYVSALWKHPIPHSDFGVEKYPFEFGIVGDRRVADIEDKNGVLVVNGISCGKEVIEAGFPPLHFGHKITTSLK